MLRYSREVVNIVESVALTLCPPLRPLQFWGRRTRLVIGVAWRALLRECCGRVVIFMLVSDQSDGLCVRETVLISTHETTHMSYDLLHSKLTEVDRAKKRNI